MILSAGLDDRIEGDRDGNVYVIWDVPPVGDRAFHNARVLRLLVALEMLGLVWRSVIRLACLSV